jgi:hypothetical protein
VNALPEGAERRFESEAGEERQARGAQALIEAGDGGGRHLQQQRPAAAKLT